MKRLLKKGSNSQVIDDIKVIDEWVIGDVSDFNIQKDIVSIIDRNHDCIYDGILYRILLIYPKINNETYTKEEFLDIIKNYINVNDSYQSFTKSYQYAKKEAFDSDFNDKNEAIIVECHNSGLDLDKFANKYQKEINELDTMIDYYQYQKEVISKLTNDFKIIAIGGIEVNQLPDIIDINLINEITHN